jgi:fibronectin-binding autotransporter adhesin
LFFSLTIKEFNFMHIFFFRTSSKEKFMNLSKRLYLAFASLLLLTSQTQAATLSWNVASGDWADPNSWNPAQTPTAGDTANINNSGIAQVISGTPDTALNINITANSTIDIFTGGSLTSNTTIISTAPGFNDTINVIGGTFNNNAGATPQIIIGQSGNGLLSISSGSVNTPTTTLGVNAASVGNLTVANANSSLIQSGNFFIGQAGQGIFQLNNGASVSNVNCTMATTSTGNTALVDGTGSTWTNTGVLTIANAGGAELTIQNNAVVTASTTVLAVLGGSTGILDIHSGGRLTTASITGQAGSASLILNGGTVQATGNTASFISGFPTGQATLVGTGIIDSQTFTITIPQVLNGVSLLTKQGTGTLILTGANTLTGGMDIAAGTLQGSVATLPTGDVADSGLLIFDQGVNATFAGSITGTGAITKQLAGNLTLTGTNDFSGGTTLTGGTLTVNTNSSGTGPILNNANLVFDQGINGSFGGNISGNGNLSKINAGTLILTGTNSYLGGTTLTAGTLQGNTNSIPSSGGIVNNASLVFDQAFTGTYSGNISGAGTLTKQNIGTLILTGPNSYAGGTFIAAGALQVSTASIPAIGNITDNAILIFDQGVNGTYANNITGTGAFIKQNSGTLILTGTNSWAGGTVIAGGALQGNTTSLPRSPILNNASLIFDQAISDTFASAISGTGSFTKTNLGTLTLTGLNSYAGGTLISAGTLQGDTNSLQGPILDNADLIFNQTFDGTYIGSLSGTGTFEKQGAGKLQMTGNGVAFSGPTTVEEGILNMNGTLGGILTINVGAKLTGTGFLDTVFNNGTIAPGNSIGTIHVVNFTNNATGIYQVEINGAGAGTKIQASNTAAIDGGQLIVTADPGIYLKGTTYVIIDAAAGLTGTFPTTILPTNVQLGVSYLPTQLILTVLSTMLDTTGLTGNPLNVANYILNNVDGDADINTVIGALNMLDPAHLRKALNQMHPALFEALALTVGDTAHMINTTFTDRLDFLRRTCGCADACKPCGKECCGGLWIAGTGDFVRQKRTGGLRRFNTNSEGVAIGYDNRVGDSLLAGVGLGYTHTNLHWGNSCGHAAINGFYVGTYATQCNDCYYIDGTVLAFVNNHRVRRHIHFATLDRKAKNNHYSYGFNPHLGAGLFWNFCSVDVIPFIDLDYYLVQQNRAREHGADSIDLHVKRNQTNLLRVETGLRFTKCYHLCGGQLIPNASVSYVGHRVLSGNKYIAAFKGIDANFHVHGTKHCFNQLELGAGLLYLINDKFAVNAWYDIELGKKRQEQEVNLEVHYNF